MCSHLRFLHRLTTFAGFIRTLSVCSFLCCALSQSYAQGKPSPFDKGPKTIASQERVTVLIDREVAQGKSSIILKISVPNDSKVNAFLLPDPPRLVVDFEGSSIKKSESFNAPENGVIKQVRLGAHPDKLRVVVDLIKSTPPEYEWKAGKRQAIISFVEGTVEAAPQPQVAAPQPTPAPALPTEAPAQPTAVPAQPTIAPTTVTTTPPAQPSSTPTSTPSVPPTAQQPATSGNAPNAAAAGAGAAAGAALPSGKDVDEDQEDLGDLEERRAGPAPTKVPTTFSIKGYRFEYMPDKSPILKILLNKPGAQAQISKVDSETYKIDLKDCGTDNEDLELPQFPPHDFVGFVMVVAEPVGSNVEISVSVEEDIVLGTSVHGNEIWVKKP
jgi:hypothetical protein